MANKIVLDISGDKQIIAGLRGLSSRGARRVLARTMMRGARTLAKEARANAPVDQADLRKSIRAKLLKGRGVVIRVAPRYSDAAHAHLVEFGTAGPRPAVKGGGSRIVELDGRSVRIDNTGIMPAIPFMRRAWDSHGKPVLNQILGDARLEIEKEAVKEARR